MRSSSSVRVACMIFFMVTFSFVQSVLYAQSSSTIVQGLKEALNVGIKNAVSLTSVQDGFYGNSAIKLPFPQDAIKVKEYATKLGLSSQVEKFELTLNRAAEEATKQALPIFKKAILDMTIQDGLALLQGGGDAATSYLKSKTRPQLVSSFAPKVKEAIDQVKLMQYWTPLATKYNSASFLTGKKVTTDLNAYVTEKAIDGLFYMVAQEEIKIRKNPAARVTSVLNTVFGSLGVKQ